MYIVEFAAIPLIPYICKLINNTNKRLIMTHSKLEAVPSSLHNCMCSTFTNDLHQLELIQTEWHFGNI